MKLLMENWRKFVSQEELHELSNPFKKKGQEKEADEDDVDKLYHQGMRKQMKSGQVTWRMLDQALRIARAEKEGTVNDERKKQLAKDLGDDVLDLAGALLPIPGLANIILAKNAAERMKGVYDMYSQKDDDETKKTPVLDAFNLDDGLQKLIDDGLEQEFIASMEKDVEKQLATNPDAAIPDIDVMIKRFVNQKELFGKDGYSVTEPPEEEEKTK